MRKPRSYSFVELSDNLEGEECIFINAHKIGGSIVPISPAQARKAGQRLIEMAAYVEDKRARKRSDAIRERSLQRVLDAR